MVPADRRRSYLAALGAAFVLSAALIVASQLTGRQQAAAAPERAAVPVRGPFAGIPQRGVVLGKASAPVTLVEFADLQCPYCADWTRQTLPVLADRYVRTGKLRIVFRGVAFLGPDSQIGLELALGAAPQHRLWNMLDELYLRQGRENSGWLTRAVAEDAARQAGVDLERLRGRDAHRAIQSGLRAAVRAAEAAGIHGTPSFELGRTGGRLSLVALRSLGPEGLIPAIDALLPA